MVAEVLVVLVFQRRLSLSKNVVSLNDSILIKYYKCDSTVNTYPLLENCKDTYRNVEGQFQEGRIMKTCQEYQARLNDSIN